MKSGVGGSPNKYELPSGGNPDHLLQSVSARRSQWRHLHKQYNSFLYVFLIQRSQMASWQVSHPWAKANQMEGGGRQASTSGPWEEGRRCQNQCLESCASKDSTSLCCCNKQPPKLTSLTVFLSCFHKTQWAYGRLVGQLSTFHGTQWSRLYWSCGSYILTEALMSKGSEPWVAIQRGFDAFAWQQPLDQNKAYSLYSQGSWEIWENRKACLVNAPHLCQWW